METSDSECFESADEFYSDEETPKISHIESPKRKSDLIINNKLRELTVTSEDGNKKDDVVREPSSLSSQVQGNIKF